MSEKQCFKCGEVKSLSDFYRHKGMADGHLNKCKDCAKSDVKKHRRENDSVREYDRRRYQEDSSRRAKAAETVRLWRDKNPERYKAHTILNNAVRDGVIEKGSCEICGAFDVHAHHDDYSKPLDVRWLCPLHHHRHHASGEKQT